MRRRACNVSAYTLLSVHTYWMRKKEIKHPQLLPAHPASAVGFPTIKAGFSQVVEQALASAQLEVADIDWLLLHQANQRILNSAADRLGVPPVCSALSSLCLSRQPESVQPALAIGLTCQKCSLLS